MAEISVQEAIYQTQGVSMQSAASDMLAEVNAAISAILAGGQEYKIGSKRLTRADLKQLYKMQLDLRGQVEAETKTSLLDDAYVAVFDGR